MPSIQEILGPPTVDDILGVDAPLVGSSTTPAPAEVRAAPPQQTGIGRYLGGVGSLLLEGAEKTLGTPGDIAKAINPAYPLYPDAPYLPTSNQLLEMSGRAGLTQRADLISEGWERVPAKMVEGLGSAVPLVLAGAPPVQTAVAGAVGGGVGEAAHELVPSSDAAPIAAGLVAGGGAGAAVRRLAQQTLESVASRLGTSETFEQAGDALERAAMEFRKPQPSATAPSSGTSTTGMDALIEAARAPLDPVMTGQTVDPTKIFAAQMTKGGQAQRAIRLFFDSTIKEGQSLGATANDLDSRGMIGLGIVPTPTWEEVRDLRSELGNYMRGSDVVGKPALERLYGGFTEAMGDAARANGAGDLFDNFNRVSSSLHNLDRGIVDDILTAKQAGSSAKRVMDQLKIGGQNVAELRSASPEFADALDELAAANLRRGGAAAHLRLSPEGQTALVADPDVQRMIGSLTPRAGESPGTHSLRALVAETAGRAGGAMLSHLLGINPFVGAEAGAAGGLLSLPVRRGVGVALAAPIAVARQPSLLAAPAAGAIAGSNALVPPTAPYSQPQP